MSKFTKYLRKYPYTFLFLSIILLMAVTPLFRTNREILIAAMFFVVMLSTIYTLHLRQAIFKICVALGVASFVLTVLNVLFTWHEYTAVAAICGVIAYLGFFGICILILLKKVFYTDSADWDSIQGGISVYFLMGFFWAFLYKLVLIVDPNAIAFVDNKTEMSDVIYFSFTTLTTLGYGDNLPVSAYAKNLTILESALGQIFLTVLVARLVGLSLNQAQNKPSQS